MSRLFFVFFFFTLFLTSPATHAQENQKVSSGKEKSAAAQSTPRAEMEGLAELAMNMGMRALAEGGQLYPFAQLAFQTPAGEQIKTMGKPKGEEIDPPEEWAINLYNTIRKASTNEKLKAAVIIKLHKAKTRDGRPVTGLWALVDHREHKPFIIFMPLIEQENGKHKPGELIYHSTEQALFAPASGAGNKTN